MEKSEELKIQLNRYMQKTLTQENFKGNVKTLIKAEFKNTLNSIQKQLFRNEVYKNLKLSVKIHLIKTVKSDNFRNEINRLIDTNLKAIEHSNQTIDSVIPAAAVNGLKVYIYNHKDEIISSIKKLLNSKALEGKITEQISTALNGLNPMMARFINLDSIQEKIMTSLNEYLDNPKNILEILNMISSQLDSFMKRKISDILNNFPAEGRKSIVDSLTATSVNMLSSEKMSDKLINLLEDKLLEMLASLNEHPEKMNIETERFIDSFIDTYYDRLVQSEQTKQLINVFSSNIVENILKKPIIDLL